jgi:hypothetical protein
MPNTELADTKQHWQEIFDSVEIETIPVKYLQSVSIKFTDGRYWEISVPQSPHDFDGIEGIIGEFVCNHKDTVVSVNFNINTYQVKVDAEQTNARFG